MAVRRDPGDPGSEAEGRRDEECEEEDGEVLPLPVDRKEVHWDCPWLVARIGTNVYLMNRPKGYRTRHEPRDTLRAYPVPWNTPATRDRRRFVEIGGVSGPSRARVVVQAVGLGMMGMLGSVTSSGACRYARS